MAILATENLDLSYDDIQIVKKLNLQIPTSKITAIIGSNGCGKSTTLKALARILAPKNGTVYLDGKAISKQSTKEIAKKMAILPQRPEAPSGITVFELITYGRFPHQKGFGKLSDQDRKVIEWALNITEMTSFKNRPIDALSGGQRQRAWIAMALAQQTDLILLDEPTTYLDLAHQLEILKLLENLNKQEGRTIVMVLHDLNLAARFADYIVAMRDGVIVREGKPETVITSEVLKEVFQIDAEIVKDPRNDTPVCLTYDLLKSLPSK
ncbi:MULTISPECIES: ABC transporter ATP-binding protein [Priestia]|uniref:ABC transporter ATP-binding protein n=1 Tax=Priestia TaxID=2800373 RepID=UPI000A917BA9|nr:MULTISPECIES: ABC transporter ATP-binding protein [Priestia]MDN4634269.1 ABC transporter ATP-binding protein [Sphingomonas sp. PsM26]MEB4860816.1 ABC transporter ATP-binding protein [Priestia megaterium]MED3821705.1 ABC transporter ATP-binding protein [Priestia aryabhattai]MED4262453.1 ABC transporter ATP-binding protein [Priestia aryabhattai]NGY89733.1 ABC transporter ATP-binding protein [Priestia megaterium]